jgi:hypothetical protein
MTALHDKEIYGRKLALSKADEKEPQKRNHFQTPRPHYGKPGSGNEEIDGNKW